MLPQLRRRRFAGLGIDFPGGEGGIFFPGVTVFDLYSGPDSSDGVTFSAKTRSRSKPSIRASVLLPRTPSVPQTDEAIMPWRAGRQWCGKAGLGRFGRALPSEERSYHLV